MTFGEAVDLYKATLAPKLKPSTHIGYMKNVDAYLLSRFGSWPLSKIDRAAVTAFDLELAREGLATSTRMMRRSSRGPSSSAESPMFSAEEKGFESLVAFTTAVFKNDGFGGLHRTIL